MLRAEMARKNMYIRSNLVGARCELATTLGCTITGKFMALSDLGQRIAYDPADPPWLSPCEPG
jgi:hypothetical protein